MIFTEDIAWEDLEAVLERMFADWRLSHPEQRAHSIVGGMRRSGWRIPLPEGTAPPKLGRPLPPERVKDNVRKCREALRDMKETGEE